MMRPPFPDLPFTTSQAGALGIRRKQLRNAVDQGEVRRVFTGVYVRAELPDSTELRARAAGLVMNGHSVLCDRTAAWIHGISVLRYAELDVIPPLETYVLRGHDPTDRHNCHGGTRDLRPEDWQVSGGIRVTTPMRTALDLACKLRRREAMAALDAFAREHEVTVAQLTRLLLRYFRRRGVVQARELVPLTDGRIESARESWVNLEIHDHGLPAPQPQYWVLVDGVPTYRVDFAYPHAKVIVEYDGVEFHSRPEKKAADEKRREWLRRNGWRVIVVTKENFDDAPTPSWIRELRGYLWM
jgi:Protein of unknown function (DUF559)